MKCARAATLVLFTLATSARDEKPSTVHDSEGIHYDLSGLTAKKDCSRTTFEGREDYINVCKSVQTETWALEDSGEVGGFTRKDRGDFSIGKVNTTLDVRDGHPLLIMKDGSKFIAGGDLKASTAIRFICDNSLLAELPPQDTTACAFFIEWRTSYACPSSEGVGFFGAIGFIILSIIALIVAWALFTVLWNHFMLGLRGADQLPTIPFDSAQRRSLRGERQRPKIFWPNGSQHGPLGEPQQLPGIFW
ncbi:mannose-6-phosphate receptor binding domain-containing protein [Thelephora terrestris]|uniref:Autophagy-related protein 27 n=1 Tax=Thelephora terrestris TaxID=56493 RepID=A0A9P6H772_9AGAM|nr:mannose-6-phosphate receptor binding domain-containing protein [Thelephora terrestris]